VPTVRSCAVRDAAVSTVNAVAATRPPGGLAPTRGWDYAHSLYSDNATMDTKPLPSGKVRRMPPHHAVLAPLADSPPRWLPCHDYGSLPANNAVNDP
jgi:hypothetical protein